MKELNITSSNWKCTDERWTLWDKGTQITGWVKDINRDRWYYCYSDDVARGWMKDTDGRWYYFSPCTQVTYNNQYYTGEMMINWVKIDNKWYYLMTESIPSEGLYKGQMLCDTSRVIDGVKYSFNSKGEMIDNSTLKGIDISNNNGAINLAPIAKSIDCVYVKATESNYFRDKYMPNFYDQCKNLDLEVGAYHFLKLNSSPESQADYFYDYIKNYDWDMVPMLDVEVLTTDAGWSPSKVADYAVRFLKRFKQICNLEIGVYTYTGYIPYLQSQSEYLKYFKLWEANYNNNPDHLPDNFFNVRVGHQYTESGVIGNFKGDVNVFKSSVLI